MPEPKEENKEKRKALAAELGELVIQRSYLAEQLNQIAARCNELATEMEKLPKMGAD